MPGSYDGRTTSMFGEAMMAEPSGSVGAAAMTGIHKAKEGSSGWV
jgi:hypothetical protein